MDNLNLKETNPEETHPTLKHIEESSIVESNKESLQEKQETNNLENKKHESDNGDEEDLFPENQSEVNTSKGDHQQIHNKEVVDEEEEVRINN